MHTYTPAQEKLIQRYIRNGSTRNRPPLSDLAKRIGIPVSTLRGEVKRRKSGTCTRKLRVTNEQVKEQYIDVRERRAKEGDHTLVTAKFVTEEHQFINNSCGRMKSGSRYKKAVTNQKNLRDPAQSPTHGRLAVLSQDKAYFRRCHRL